MLDLYTRTAILRLLKEGHGVRTIAKSLRLSRNAVRDVVRSGIAEVPDLEREERLNKSLDLVRTSMASRAIARMAIDAVATASVRPSTKARSSMAASAPLRTRPHSRLIHALAADPPRCIRRDLFGHSN